MKEGVMNRRIRIQSLVAAGILLGLLALVGSAQAPAGEPAPKVILGIFGGMGPEATANMYQLVVRSTPAKQDQDHLPTLIYSLPQVPDRTAAILNHDPSIVPYLVEGVTRLERAGASFIIIPCNTAHYFYDDMQRAVKIPILHMIRETADEVARRYPDRKRVGLLATSGTIATGLYEKELTARGFTVLVPDDAVEADCVMGVIYDIKAGRNRARCEDQLAKAGRHLEKKGAQVLVLGCTEIPLAFNPARAHVPVVNATQVLADAAIRKYRELTSRP
jgi:aspartate racemase